MFARRSAIFGVAGGLVLGTMLFGKPDLALKRAYNRFEYYIIGDISDSRASDDMYTVKFNN